MAARAKFTKQITPKFRPETATRVRELAEKEGVSESMVIRRAIETVCPGGSGQSGEIAVGTLVRPRGLEQMVASISPESHLQLQALCRRLGLEFVSDAVRLIVERELGQ